MAELVADRTWRIQGRTVSLPVRITDARTSVAVFTADPERAADVLAAPQLRPWTAAGRAFGVLMVVRYGEWVLGRYDEVGVGLVVRGPDGRRGLHLVDLPVTGEFTCEAGRDLWALPKWLMRCDLDFAGRSASVTVHDGDRFVMRARLAAGPLPVQPWQPTAIPTWSHLGDGAQAGRLLHGVTRFRLRGVRLGRGAAEVELGAHPMAERMAALGMAGRPLLVGHTRHGTGELDAFEAVEALER